MNKNQRAFFLKKKELERSGEVNECAALVQLVFDCTIKVHNKSKQTEMACFYCTHLLHDKYDNFR